MSEVVIWDNGKPVMATPKEAKRLRNRIEVVCAVLVSMGYSDIDHITEEWNVIVTKLAKDDFKLYIKFLDKVDELSKEHGC